MKKIKISLFFVLVGTLAAFSQRTSKEQKIVCFKRSIVLQEMPEYEKAQRDLKKVEIGHQNAIQKMVSDMQAKYSEFQKSNDPKLKKEIETLQIKAQEYETKAREDLIKQQENHLSPIIKKIDGAVKKIANNDPSIIRIDDCSEGGAIGLYVKDGYDITEKIRLELKK